MASPDPKSSTLQRKRTMAGTNASTLNRGSTKKQDSFKNSLMLSNKKDAPENEIKGNLSSPTSVSMKNTFIIKNADESFDINSK